jgi:hypothetical protein
MFLVSAWAGHFALMLCRSLACGLFDGFIRAQKERSWNRQRPTQDAPPLHPFCLIDSVGRFDRHDGSTTENSSGRRSNFNGFTQCFRHEMIAERHNLPDATAFIMPAVNT